MPLHAGKQCVHTSMIYTSTRPPMSNGPGIDAEIPASVRGWDPNQVTLTLARLDRCNEVLKA